MLTYLFFTKACNKDNVDEGDSDFSIHVEVPSSALLVSPAQPFELYCFRRLNLRFLRLLRTTWGQISACLLIFMCFQEDEIYDDGDWDAANGDKAETTLLFSSSSSVHASASAPLQSRM